MRRNSRSLLLLLVVTTSLTVRAQQTSFTVGGIKPFDKAVPGQVMEVLIEGLGSLEAPMILPESDFKVEVWHECVKQELLSPGEFSSHSGEALS